MVIHPDRIPARVTRCAALLFCALSLAGCSPEVGSDAWCKDLDAKPKADWSANELADYTRHCVIGLKPKSE